MGGMKQRVTKTTLEMDGCPVTVSARFLKEIIA
jgi:hypothetical protein